MTFDTQMLQDKFNSFFQSNSNEFSLYFAPGRVNLIGEHTDYTGGLVFPAGIDRGTYILTKPNDNSTINLVSLNFSDKIETIYLDRPLQRENNWSDYIRGILVELNRTDDYSLGFDAVIYGNIPNSAGLSSSASLEMAAIIAIMGINEKRLPLPGTGEMVEYVKMATKAENDFIGVKCGIMDQFAVANAKRGHAIKLDCFSLDFSYARLDLQNHQLLVMNTNKKRRLEESKYNERRLECERGFELIKNAGIEKEVLGRVTIDEWNSIKSDKVFKTESTLSKRLEHVITENDRVKRAQLALDHSNIPEFSRLINESGASLRINYEVTGFHLDAIVDSALATDGVIASRMTGAGFGGCAICIIKREMASEIQKEIAAKYRKTTDMDPTFYTFNIGDGAQEISL